MGKDDRVPRSNLLSSAMMSLQTSTHSSQIKTVGPAISLRTSFWSLLQNEQRRTSVSPVFFVVMRLSRASYRRPADPPLVDPTAASCPSTEDIINNTVVLRLNRVHDVVPIGVRLNPLGRLARVARQDCIQHLALAQD